MWAWTTWLSFRVLRGGSGLGSYIRCGTPRLVVLIACGLPAQQQVCAEPGALEQFKSFLSSRPNVEEIIYVQFATLQEDIRTPGGTQGNLIQDASYTLARWQKGDYLLKSAGTLEAVGATNLHRSCTFLGLFRGAGWQMSPPVLVVYQTPGFERALIERFHAALQQTLHFGLPMVQDGSIIWNRSELRGRAASGELVTGRLDLDPSGRPSELVCKVEGRPWSYRISYSYDPSQQGRWWPGEFSTAVIPEDGGAAKTVLRVGIVKLVIRETPLPVELIDPLHLFPRGQRLLQVSSNGLRFQERADGSFMPVQPQMASPGPAIRKVFIVFMLAVSAAVAFVVYRRIGNVHGDTMTFTIVN